MSIMVSRAKYQIMPPLSAVDLASLEASILINGVLVPVEYDDEGEIIDGHHRVSICQRHGLSWPRVVRPGLNELEKRSVARQLNLARRHLNAAQKRKIIEDQLIDTPHYSNRMIGTLIGADGKTVRAHRRWLEASGLLGSMGSTMGMDGVRRPSTRRTTEDPWRTLSLRDGELVGNLTWYELEIIVRENERDNHLLRSIKRHCVTSDNEIKVRDAIAFDIVAAFAEGGNE